MNYMNTSLCFIDREHTENSLQTRVVKGFHGLHHYANEFWFQHLLQYAKTGISVEDDELDHPLEEIREFWKAEPGGGAKTLKLDDTTSAESILSQLEVLTSMEQARKMGIDILTFRKFLSQERFSHQDPASECSILTLR
jgi:hypothetical protein